MNKAVIFHGSGSTPDMYWFPYLREQLESRGYEVWVPQLPNADEPKLSSWLATALEYKAYDEGTVLVGHSSGCPLILALLEELTSPVRQTILVSGYARMIDQSQEPILKSQYDWDRVSENAGDLIVINSDDDPWGCQDDEGRFIFDNAGGTQIVRHSEGHMGSLTFDQPYREFPLLLQLIG